MDNPGDLMHLCRLCLVKDQVNIPIFEEHGDIRQIFVKISSCLPVKVSKDDQLPKRICDGCSNKLDLLYEFCNTSANSEKKLLSWLEQAGLKDVDTISAVAQHTAKPLETQTQVKQEALEDIHAAVQQTDHLELTDEGVGAAVFEENAIDESDEPPPPKRARRTAAVKAQINITPDSDDDDDMDISEPMTKVEDESDDSDVDKDPSYVDVPGTSADDQPGPSGVGKDGVEAPFNFDDPWTHECQRCSKMFPTNFALLKHSLVCDPSWMFRKCSVCDKFVRKERYDRHVVWHKVKRKKQIHSCDQCDKTFRSQQYLKLHVERVHENKGVQYPCDVCAKIFSTKYRAEYHKKTIHLKDFNLRCEQCGRGFLYVTELTTHVRKVHDKEISVFSCNFDGCNRHFRSNATLQYHIQVVHLKVGANYVCSHCNKAFQHVSLYRRHLSRHIDPKKYPCSLCGNQYTSKRSLEVHFRSHTGERPFVCEHCGQSFTARKYLKVHLVVHTKERPHSCEYCGKSFTQKGSLNIHVKKDHSGQNSLEQIDFFKST